MSDGYVVVSVVNLLVLVLGVSIGRSLVLLRLRREENRRRELEAELLDKRAQVIERGKQIVTNLEDLIYKTNVQQEIDKIIRKRELD